MFGNVRGIFGQVFEIIGNLPWSKTFGNRQKRRHQDVYIIKRTLHVNSKIGILCSHGKNNTYCSCHLNIKFISSRNRVISSTYM